MTRTIAIAIQEGIQAPDVAGPIGVVSHMQTVKFSDLIVKLKDSRKPQIGKAQT